MTPRSVSSQPSTGDRRGQSSPLGLALVFAVMIIGATMTLSLGGQAIFSTKSQLDVDRAEKTMTQLDSLAALVALGDSDVQDVNLPSGSAEGYQVQDSAGHIEVEHTKTASLLVDDDLGKLTYEISDDETIAYQGGGVWKKSDDNSVMVSPPEFHYRDETLTLPLITISGDSSVSGRAVLTKASTTQVETPGGNPISSGKVIVRVESEYYEAWGKFFEQRTDGVVDYDHTNEKVEVELVTTVGKTKATSAVAGSAAGKLLVSGNGGEHPCDDSGGPALKYYTDSYDSSTGDSYCDQYDDAGGPPSDDGNVTFGGDIEATGASEYYGSLKSGSEVEVSGSAEVNGDIYYTTNCIDCSSGQEPGYEIEQISGVSSWPQINSIVGEKRQEIDASNNDNDDAYSGVWDPIVTNTLNYELDATGRDTATIDKAGSYYLESIETGSDEELVLDTTNGDITIVVRDYIEIEKGRVYVQGDNEVEIYVLQDAKVSTSYRDSGVHLDGGKILTPKNDSTQLTVYGNDTLNTSFEKEGSAGSQFDGVIWAPIGSNGPGGMYVKHSDVYGGVVTGDVEIDNKGRIHYDKALGNKQIVSQGTNIVKITYLHITKNEVEISNG